MNELPIIDIAPLLDASQPAAWPAVDGAIGDAIERFGGFVVSGYPQADMVDQWGRTALRFYELPDEHKHEVSTRVWNPAARTVYRGYRSSLRPGEWAYNENFASVTPISKSPSTGEPFSSSSRVVMAADTA